MRREDFRTLYGRLADEPLLSVYLDGTAPDPAMNGAWRVAFATAVQEVRALTRKRAPRQAEALESALAWVEKELAGIPGRLPTDGLVAFASASAVEHLEHVHASVPTQLAWKRGPLAAPYLPVLEPDETVWVVDVAQDVADLYRYDGGRALTRLSRFEVEVTHEAAQTTGVMKSVKGTSGFSGSPARDAADRALREDRRRMLAAVETSLGARLAPQDRLLVFGSQTATAHLIRLLRPPLKRSVVAESLEAHHSEATLLESTRRALSLLAGRDFEALLAEAAERAHRDGHGTLGTIPVRRAVNRGAVDTLLLSDDFCTRHSTVAESLIGGTFRAGGSVRRGDGAAGAGLDHIGAGVGARLRFPVP